MSRKRTILAATIAAILAEAGIGAMFYAFGHIGGDGPDTIGWIGLVFHLPGVYIADVLHLTGSADTLFISFTGAMQFFLIFWLAIEAWGRFHKNK
jgi:hypothetical protein